MIQYDNLVSTRFLDPTRIIFFAYLILFLQTLKFGVLFLYVFAIFSLHELQLTPYADALRRITIAIGFERGGHFLCSRLEFYYSQLAP